MNTALTAFLGGAAAGIAGASLVLVLAPRSSTKSASLPPVEPRTAAADEGLRAELAELRSELDGLAMQVALLAERPEPASSARAEVAPTPVPAMDDDLRALAAALVDPNAPLPAGLRETVSDVLTDIRADEERERREQAEEARRTLLEERLGVLAQDLGLAAYQTDELRTLATHQMERMSEVFEDSRSGGDFTAARDTMRAIRDEAQADLARILTPEQLQRFEEERMGRGLFGFGPPGFFGGGEGRGPGGNRQSTPGGG